MRLRNTALTPLLLVGFLLAGCAPQGGSPRQALPVAPEHEKQNQETSKAKSEEVKSTPAAANADAAENH